MQHITNIIIIISPFILNIILIIRKNIATIRDRVDLQDLEAGKAADTIPLKIQDVRRYFDSNTSTSTTTTTTSVNSPEQVFTLFNNIIIAILLFHYFIIYSVILFLFVQ